MWLTPINQSTTPPGVTTALDIGSEKVEACLLPTTPIVRGSTIPANPVRSLQSATRWIARYQRVLPFSLLPPLPTVPSTSNPVPWIQLHLHADYTTPDTDWRLKSSAENFQESFCSRKSWKRRRRCHHAMPCQQTSNLTETTSPCCRAKEYKGVT